MVRIGPERVRNVQSHNGLAQAQRQGRGGATAIYGTLLASQRILSAAKPLSLGAGVGPLYS